MKLPSDRSAALWAMLRASAVVVLAAAASAVYAIPPTAETANPADESQAGASESVQGLMTPQAEIRLGAGRCDTELMMRQAGARRTGATYALRSLWRGIVEYLLPDYGLFRRGDALARVYDPELLPDLERARRLMSTAEVSPVTILPPRREEAAGEPGAQEAQPQPVLPAAPSLRVDPQALAPGPATSDEAASDVDLQANYRQQHALREQARLTARTVAAAIKARNEAKLALEKADKDLAERQRLCEAGTLAEGALEPTLERVAAAKRALDVAEQELDEAQEGYGRLAREIRALEREADRAMRELRPAAGERPEAGAVAAEPGAAEEEAAELAPAPLRETPSEEAEVQPLAPEVTELAAPRWQEVEAPATGLVADIVAPAGSLVEEGQELLQLADVQLARLAARVHQPEMPEFWPGRAVSIAFEDYPEVALEGWVASYAATEDSEDAEVEFLVVCESGALTNDAYLAVQWMALEAGVKAQDAGSHALEPVREPGGAVRTDRYLQRLFPLVGPEAYVRERSAQADRPSKERYAGRLRLREVQQMQGDPAAPEGKDARRLAALGEWRATYIDGMATTILDDGTAITYPREGQVSRAVRRMLEGRVSHRPNLCAATMREALGWGLGDAHAWASRLPHMGYTVREDGLARPGDILVWPFSYGPRRAEHIGIAVRQGRRLMLLSNLGGRLGTGEILGGYLAFYHPDQRPDKG